MFVYFLPYWLFEKKVAILEIVLVYLNMDKSISCRDGRGSSLSSITGVLVAILETIIPIGRWDLDCHWWGAFTLWFIFRTSFIWKIKVQQNKITELRRVGYKFEALNRQQTTSKLILLNLLNKHLPLAQVKLEAE